jgi:hypothetical protein
MQVKCGLAYHSPESVLIVLRDAIRALFWIITGHTGESLKKFFQ